jgi:hypothetical protein
MVSSMIFVDLLFENGKFVEIPWNYMKHNQKPYCRSKHAWFLMFEIITS